MCGVEYTLLGADRRPYKSSGRGALGGHLRSRLYGRLDCPAALRAIARGGYVKNRVFFADEKTAVESYVRDHLAKLVTQPVMFTLSARE